MGAFLSNTAEDDAIDRAWANRSEAQRAKDKEYKKNLFVVAVVLCIIGAALLLVYQFVPAANNDYYSGSGTVISAVGVLAFLIWAFQ
jgi:nitrate reductase NapE component